MTKRYLNTLQGGIPDDDPGVTAVRIAMCTVHVGIYCIVVYLLSGR